MSQHTTRNVIFTSGDVTLIRLDADHNAMINTSDLPRIRNYTWRAVRYRRCFYAKTTVRDGSRIWELSMHRMIAKTPPGEVCHHRNRNSLDNREENLLNMMKKSHDFLHSNNSLIIKYKKLVRDENTPPTGSEGGILS